jgi:pimeloyl-ACP methyl ester carboxylesterase
LWSLRDPKPATRAPECEDRPVRGPVLVAVIVVAVTVAGCGDDSGPSTRTAPPPAAAGPAQGGRTLTVGGKAMHIDCRGTARPTVVLDAGLGVDARATWSGVAPEAAKLTRTCWYDRAGTGQSDARPGPRTSATMVADLRGLLQAAGERGPYVLVGASEGGLNDQLFAAQHPREVAGLVLVDAVHPDLDRRIAPVLGRAGAAARARALAQNAEGVRFADLLASDAQVRHAGPLPPVPLVALRHGVSFDPGGRPDPKVERLWTALQRDLAKRSPQGQYVRVPGSHHRIAEDHPEAVVTAIQEVVSAARATSEP